MLFIAGAQVVHVCATHVAPPLQSAMVQQSPGTQVAAMPPLQQKSAGFAAAHAVLRLVVVIVVAPFPHAAETHWPVAIEQMVLAP